MTPQQDALLCVYRRAHPDPLTVEDIERTHPRISASTIASIGAELEKRGWICPAAGGGHVLTNAGEQAYLDALDD